MPLTKYKNGGYLQGDVSTGASIGSSIGSVVPGIGTAIGGVAGAAVGGLTSLGSSLYDNDHTVVGGAYKRLMSGESKLGKVGQVLGWTTAPWMAIGARRARKAEEKQNAIDAENQQLAEDSFDKFSTNQNKQVAMTYPNQGVRGVSSFRNGGVLGGGTVKNLSKDVSQFDGASHEMGGIDLNIGAEVEGGETVSKKRVFSDFLLAGSDLAEVVESMTGIKVGEGTYAEASEAVAAYQNKTENLKGKFADKTKKVLDERSEKALDLIFEDQEMNKPVLQGNEMRSGGRLPDKTGPVGMMGKVDPHVPFVELTSFDGDAMSRRMNFGTSYPIAEFKQYSNTPAMRGRSKGIENPVVENPVVTPQTTTNSKSTTQQFKPFENGAGQRSLDYSPYVADNVTMPKSIATRDAVKPIENTFANRLATKGVNINNISPDMISQAANAAAFMLNKKDIDKLEDHINPTYMDAPRYNYRDSSNAQMTAVGQAASNNLNTLRRTSTQGNAGVAGELAAAEIAGKNQVASTETARENAALQDFNRRVGAVNAGNVDITNTFKQINNTLANTKIATNINARNTLLQGIQGNLQNASDREMDLFKSALAASAQGDTGAFTRTLQELAAANPEIAQAIIKSGFSLT